MGLRSWLAERRARRNPLQETVTTKEVKPDTASVYVTDYVGGGAKEVTTTSTGGGASHTTTKTISPTGQISTTPTITPTPPKVTIIEKVRTSITTPNVLQTAYGIELLRRTAKFSGERIIEPSLKFFAGGYEFQKKIEEEAKKAKPTAIDKRIGYEGYTEKEPSPEKKFSVVEKISESYWKYTDVIDKTLRKIGVEPNKNILTKEVNVYSPQIKTLPGEVALWAFFAPAMETAAYGRQLKKQLTKTRFSELEGKLAAAEREIASKRNLEEQAIVLKKIRDGLKTEEELAGFDEWVRGLRNREILKVPEVIIKQEGGQTIIETPTYSPKSSTPSTITGEMNIQIPQVREVAWLAPTTVVQQPSLSTNIFEQQQEKAKQDILYFQREFQKEKQKQVPLLKTKQSLIQPQLTGQLTSQASSLKSAQISALLSLQTSVLKSKLSTGTITQQQFKKRILLLPKASTTKLLKRLKEISARKQSVDVVVGMKLNKARTLYKNLPPKLALKKAQIYVDKNIEASFKLKVNKKKPKLKDIKRVKISPKFRASKKSPLYRVEKTKYRLDSPTEKKQMKIAKRRYKLK